MRMERESGKGNEREGEKVVVIQREREKGERGIEKVGQREREGRRENVRQSDKSEKNRFTLVIPIINRPYMYGYIKRENSVYYANFSLHHLS